MASISDTNVAAFENQVWDTEVLQARYAKAVIMPRVLEKSSLVSDSGQIVHIPVKPKFAGGTVGSDGTFTAETQTTTDIQITVDTWKYVAITIPDKQSKQSIVTLETELPSQFGEKLSVFYDIDLANLYSQLTGTAIGTAASPIQFIKDSALTAVLNLRRNDIPLENMSWILPPEAFYLGWTTQMQVTDAYATGLPKSVLTTNSRQPILNIPSYESTLLAGSTNNTSLSGGAIAGMLIHKEAMGIAMQINNKYERVRTTPAGQLATLVVANNLYGVKIVRADHGLPIYIRNSAV